MTISTERVAPRINRRRARLLRAEARRAERRAKVVPLFPMADAAGRAEEDARWGDRAAAFMADLDFTDSGWF